MSELRATLCVALAAAGWGTWTLFTRGSGIAPVWQSVLILAVIALTTLPFAAVETARRPARAKKLWLLVALLGALDAGNYFFFFSAIDRGPVGVAVLAHYLAPVMVAALAPTLLAEPLGRRTPASLVASLLGLSLLLYGTGGMRGDALWAAIFGAASAFFYGGNTLVSKRLLGEISSAELLGYHCIVSSALLALLGPFVAGPPPHLAQFIGRPLVGALLLGCGSGAVFYLGLKRIPAQRAAVLTYFEPLVAALVGVIAWGEEMGPLAIAGALLILAGGVAVATEPEAKDARQVVPERAS